MANKKNETSAKLKAAPAATPLEEGQQTQSSESKVPSAPPDPVEVGKVEKGKKAQVAKKSSKEQQMLDQEPTKDQSKVPTERQAPSEVQVSDGEAKDRKAKEAKAKKQVAVEPATTETAPVSKKTASEQASEKATKMKRLTLDIAKPLHKAIKAKAVEDGVPMVDMLRSLLEEHYGK